MNQEQAKNDRLLFKKWRKELNFTQIEAAQALGVSFYTIINFEQGRNRLKPQLLLAMSALAAGLKPYE